MYFQLYITECSVINLLPLLSGPMLVSLEPVSCCCGGPRLGARELPRLRLGSVSGPDIVASSSSTKIYHPFNSNNEIKVLKCYYNVHCKPYCNLYSVCHCMSILSKLYSLQKVQLLCPFCLHLSKKYTLTHSTNMFTVRTCEQRGVCFTYVYEGSIDD